MTWEWIILISVLLVCTTVFCCCAVIMYKPKEHSIIDLGPLQAEINQIKADHASVARVAEESKKLLSQTNLAAGFTPRGQR